MTAGGNPRPEVAAVHELRRGAILAAVHATLGGAGAIPVDLDVGHDAAGLGLLDKLVIARAAGDVDPCRVGLAAVIGRVMHVLAEFARHPRDVVPLGHRIGGRAVDDGVQVGRRAQRGARGSFIADFAVEDRNRLVEHLRGRCREVGRRDARDPVLLLALLANELLRDPIGAGEIDLQRRQDLRALRVADGDDARRPFGAAVLVVDHPFDQRAVGDVAASRISELLAEEPRRITQARAERQMLQLARRVGDPARDGAEVDHPRRFVPAVVRQAIVEIDFGEDVPVADPVGVLEPAERIGHAAVEEDGFWRPQSGLRRRAESRAGRQTVP